MISHPFLEHAGVLAFAHRGDGNAAPENTLAAFASAYALGYRYFETDVHLSRDGVLLAFHDDKLDRVTDSEGVVAELAYAEIKKAKVGGCEPVPLMCELLEEFPDIRFNIEPKSDAAVCALIDLIKATNAIDRVCLGSFQDHRLQQIRRALPRACTSMGQMETFWARIASLGLPAPRINALCAQVPTHHYRIPVADKRFIDYLHAKGLQTHIWTINDEAEMHRLLDIGVHGLMSDDSALLKRVLLARGQWH